MKSFYLYSPLVLQTVIWPIVRPLFLFFLHLEIRGLENLEGLNPRPTSLVGSPEQTLQSKVCSRGVIFAVNHSSELDPILVPASLSFLSPLMPFFYTSREQAFYKTSGWRQFFYGGFLFKLWGSHSVHSGAQNYEESLKTHIEILNKGRSVCIFPEGRKTQDGAVGTDAHGGVAYLAYRTHASVVPVRINGVFKMAWSDFLLRKRAVRVIFGQPLSPAELFPRNVAPSLSEIKSAASRVLKEISRL